MGKGRGRGGEGRGRGGKRGRGRGGEGRGEEGRGGERRGAPFDEWVDYNKMELVKGSDRRPLRKGPKGFAVATVDGEEVETLVPNATVQAAGVGKALRDEAPRQAHPKGGAPRKLLSVRKRPGCAVEDSDDEERDSSDDMVDANAEHDAAKRRPAAAGPDEPLAAKPAGSAPPPQPMGPPEGKAWGVMWYKRHKAVAVRQVHAPKRQVTQWAAGAAYSEAQMRDMAARIVNQLSNGYIAEGEARAKGLQFLRENF